MRLQAEIHHKSQMTSPSSHDKQAKALKIKTESMKNHDLIRRQTNLLQHNSSSYSGSLSIWLAYGSLMLVENVGNGSAVNLLTTTFHIM